MRVYLAGPMTGLPDNNFHTFYEVEEQWRKAGHTAFNPARFYDTMGYDPSDREMSLRHIMLSDIMCVWHAEAVALIREWENSKGTVIELGIAQFFGLRTFDAHLMTEVEIRTRPWSTPVSTLEPAAGDNETKELLRSAYDAIETLMNTDGHHEFELACSTGIELRRKIEKKMAWSIK